MIRKVHFMQEVADEPGSISKHFNSRREEEPLVLTWWMQERVSWLHTGPAVMRNETLYIYTHLDHPSLSSGTAKESAARVLAATLA